MFEGHDYTEKAGGSWSLGESVRANPSVTMYKVSGSGIVWILINRTRVWERIDQIIILMKNDI